MEDKAIKYQEAEIASSPNTYSESMGEEPKIKESNYQEAEVYMPEKYDAPESISVGNISGGSSGLKLGESKYDEGMPYSEVKYGDIDHARAERQGFFNAFGSGLLSRGISIAPKIAEGFGHVAGAIPALVTGDIDYMTKNPIVNGAAMFDEYLREELPVFASEGYDSDLISKFTSRKFWFDDAFDGLAFAASAWVPAGAFGAVGKALKLGEKAITALKAGNKMYSQMLKNAPLAITTVYNTVSEAGFEAKDTQDTVFKNLIANGFSPEEAKKRAASAAAHTFNANSAVLLLPNAIQSKFFMGGFKKTSKTLKKQVFDAIMSGEQVSKSALKEVGSKVALGIASEGLWEEGIQNAIQQYEKRATEASDYYNNGVLDTLALGDTNYLKEYVRGYTTDEGITSMTLGAIIGGLMGGAFTYKGLQDEKKQIKAIEDHWNDHIENVLNKNDEAFKSNIVNAINKKTGDTDVNELARQIFRTIYDKQSFTEQTAALANEDPMHHEYNTMMATARYMYGYLEDSNFDSIDDAYNYAMGKLEKLKEESPEEIDDEQFALIQKYAEKTKAVYDENETERSRLDGFTDDQNKINFGRIVSKTMFYEKMKQNVLNDLKDKLSEDGKAEVDSLIKDSNKRINDLRNKTTRNKLFDNFQDSQKKTDQKIKDLAELKKIELELTSKKKYGTEEILTEDDIKEREKRFHELYYKTREDDILNGEIIPNGFESAIDSKNGIEELATARLGIIDQARFAKGMRFKKNTAVKEALDKYNDSEGTVTEVLDSIMDNTTDASPITDKDIKILNELLKDSKEIASSVENKDIEKAEAIDKIAEMIGLEKALEFEGVTKEEYDEVNKALEARSNISKINSIINANKDAVKNRLSDDELNKAISPNRLSGIAMNTFLNEETDSLINKYDNSKDSFMDINGVEKALYGVLSAKAALESEERKDFAKSREGQVLKARIDSLIDKLNEIRNEAIRNKGNKQAYDENFANYYGQ